ncbi:MAG TPA: class I SAM-dependent methyltransferase [Xanthobacteraceae bacterium]|jgi:S-adenosylmethionine-diacylgycerolhomoserine-N-methlytransferase|nr:class I SAM-dependent methyltransferase [Xanthobacteraceae bacterium]
MTDAALSMDRMYRRQRHVYDLTRKYYLLGRDRMIDGLDARPGHRVLEIGCGTGRNLIQAARRHPQALFNGIDVSREMLASADGAIVRAGMTSRIAVACADATHDNPARLWDLDGFDRIFISYTLSMIPQWRAVVRHSLAALNAGGTLHIVDFGGQEALPSWFRAGLRHWLGLFDVRPCDDLEQVLAAHAGAGLIFERPFGGYAQNAIMRR